MAKKRIILFIASIFFLGTLGTGLCLTFSSKVAPNCCLTKSSSSRDSEDCFSHCAKQKLDIIKIERYLGEEVKTKTPLFLDSKSFLNLQNYLYNSVFLKNRYSNQVVSKLNISVVYFMATFNHAPPMPLN